MSWESLPPELIKVTLLNSDDFGTVISAHDFDRYVRSLLDCPPTQSDPRILTLVDDLSCELSPEQRRFLAELNVRFKLYVSEPLTFPKLRRAYNRSVFDPKCNLRTTLFACMKTAARLGLSKQLRPTGATGGYDYHITVDSHQGETIGNTLLDSWLRELRQNHAQIQASKYLNELPGYVHSNTGLTDLLLKLSVVASKYDHVDLSQELFVRSKVVTWSDDRLVRKAKYWNLKAQVRVILRPYKVKTTKQIRDEHWLELFAADVTDDRKAQIWQSKYQFPTSDVAELIKTSGGYDPKAIGAALAKLGISDDSNDDGGFIVTLFSAKSGNAKILAQSGHSNNRHVLIVAVKRGFFNIVKEHRRGFFGPNKAVKIWGKEQYMYKYFRNFSLKQIELFNDSLAITLGYQEYASAPELDIALVNGGCTRLFLEYISGDNNKISHYGVLQNLISDIQSVPIINALLDDIVPYDFAEIRTFVNFWTEHNYRFLIKVWLEYGRRQFEDSLIYLRSIFGVSVIDAPKLVQMAVSMGAVGLLAYMFGYQLSNNESVPLMSPGIITYDFRLYEAKLRRDFREDQTTLIVPMYPEVTKLLIEMIRLTR